MNSEYVTLSISIPRRWLRFNLRTVLVLTLVVALGFGVAYGLSQDPIRPLAIQGCSPVSLLNDFRWVRGKKDYAAPYQGRVYHFVNDKEREEFLKSPDKFALAASGIDVVLAKNVGREEYGFREFGFKYDGKMYLFSTKASMREFKNTPATYAEFGREWTQRKY